MITGTPDLIAGFKALDAARDAYELRWAYYAGQLPERFLTERIEQIVRDASGETQYRFRFAKIPIDALRNRVQVASITGATAEITEQIEQIRQANDLEMIEPFTHERMFALGDAYMLTWPTDPDDDALPEPLRDAGVEIRYQSALTVRAMYDAEDGLRLRYVIRRRKEVDPVGTWRWKAELWYPGDGGYMEPWVAEDGASGLDAQSWRPDLDAYDGEWPVMHGHGMPFHHGRTSLPYGRPEHADAMGPQDVITKTVMTQAVELDSHGFPERWELIKASNPDTGSDTVRWPDETPTPDKTSRRPGRRGGPGTVSILEGRDGTGEYGTPNPSELTPAMDQFLQMTAAVTATPSYEYDPAGNAGLSGAARRWADRPLDAREKNAKRALVRFWRSVWAGALGIVGAPSTEVDVEWAAPAVEHDPDFWAVAGLKRDHGVPQDVILREANYPADEVKKWLDDDQNEAVALAHRIRMVKELAEGLSTLGSAITLGVVSQEQVDALVQQIMGGAGVDAPGPDPREPAPAPALPVVEQ